MTLKRMDNVGIVVDNLEATIEFFRELGLELEGRTMVEGERAGRVTGEDVHRAAATDGDFDVAGFVEVHP
jgi:catechol 2,3-dioxygenase-like lactoylglutathione lyase family enzyme